MRFPISPRCEADDGIVGPAVPKAWVGMSGAAEGLLNFAIRSLRDPETALGLASPPAPPGEEDRELDAGGVKLDLNSVSAIFMRDVRYLHDCVFCQVDKLIEWGREAK
jgi:hypothetical protein